MLHEAERNNNVAHKESLILSTHKDFEFRLYNQCLELISSEFWLLNLDTLMHILN